jgi:hypothetical protein
MRCWICEGAVRGGLSQGGHQTLDAHHMVGVEQQHGQQRALPLSTKVELLSVRAANFDRAQYPELHCRPPIVH